MRLKNIVLALLIIPVAICGADVAVASGSRVGVKQGNNVTRMPTISGVGAMKKPKVSQSVEKRAATKSVVEDEDEVEEEEETESTKGAKTAKSNGNCREAYQACMDDFCLLDETEGGRCACSANIERSKKLIQEIQQIQSEADELYTTGVEKEKLGAKAKLVFGSSEAAKKSSAKTGIDFASWLKGDSDDDEDDLAEDIDIGQGLYEMAAESCEEELRACGGKADMEETVYERKIVADCKAFDGYLKDQKADAMSNKRTAEAAVRSARLEMLDTTNKYNRGECLLMYRSCIADKGGCGVNFENCLDEDLLTRRSHACEDVLDQCMATRDYVLKDWQAESVSILADAAKYADRNQRATCIAKIQNCLEEGCSTSTESACLSDVKVAAGICPIITECNEKIPGLQSVINDKLGYLQVKFCENDIDACLKDKCGVDFTKPECVGKQAREIADSMCPQTLFPSCKKMGGDNYQVIINSAMLHMDYQLLTGCVNQFAEKLTAVCGTDMACIPVNDLLTATDESGEVIDTSKWIDLNSSKGKELQAAVRKAADAAVDKFFDEFAQDQTLSACQDVYGKGSSKVKGRQSVKDNVNLTAKMIAKFAARNRADRELTSLMDNLKIKAETDASRKLCLETYKKESRPTTNTTEEKGVKKSVSYSYIRSVEYEADQHNCHVCRMQQVCEKGGEKKATSALKAAAGGLSAGASAGTMVSPGWGTAIGGLVGAVGAGAIGAASGGEEEYCQELESCEDINIHEKL
ncbi:MAG: hypothetical protein J5608_03385 [Alphaproteobacteria bacterium]|nr:hypothetical protein [Alphaproteobacteria bacterium]